jgi:hypothetical protein
LFEVFDVSRDGVILTIGTFASPALPGLEVDLDELFACLDVEEA